MEFDQSKPLYIVAKKNADELSFCNKEGSYIATHYETALDFLDHILKTEDVAKQDLVIAQVILQVTDQVDIPFEETSGPPKRKREGNIIYMHEWVK